MDSGALDPTLAAGFQDEASQYLALLNDCLLAVERGEHEPATVDAMFRAAHSLKGAAGFLDLTPMVTLTHRLETCLDRVRKGEAAFTPPAIEALFLAVDTLGAQLAALGAQQETVDPDQALDALTALDQHPPEPAPTGQTHEHLGALPDWLVGRLDETDVCEAIVAQAAGERVYALRLSLSELFAAHLDPLRVHRTLAERLRIQHVIPIAHGPEDPFAPLERFGHDVGLFCFAAGELEHLLTQAPLPAMEVWELDPAREAGPRHLSASASVDLGEPATRLIVRADMARHRDGWIDQTHEDLDELETALLELERVPELPNQLDRAFRCVHRIKGSAATMGLEEMARVAHNCEHLLANLRAGGHAPQPPTFRALFAVRDHLRSTIDRIADGSTTAPDASHVDALLGELLDVTPQPSIPDLPPWRSDADKDRCAAEATAAGRHVWQIQLILRPGAPMPGIRYGMILHNLARLGEILWSEPSLDALSAGHDPDTPLQVLFAADDANEDFADALAVDQVARCSIDPVRGGPAALAGTRGGTGASRVDTIRVEAERLDRILNTAGELLIAKARVTSSAEAVCALLDGLDLRELDAFLAAARRSDRRGVGGGFGEDRLHRIELTLDRLRATRSHGGPLRDALQELHRQTGAMQATVMQVRMVPIGPLFQRFHRLVRDVAKERERSVDLVTAGEGTELDKRLIDELTDPLTHLLRNAVDHGLESPADRRAAGKPETGTVRLEAFHAGGQVCIRVSDDGRGLDTAAIRAKAIERGVIDAQSADELSEAAIHRLIFAPGFSTAETVTSISGRGVGMDIVHSRIADLKGTVEIDARPGQGSAFTLRLPLTLAMIDALLVRIGAQRYAFPLEAVREIVEIDRDRIANPRGACRMISLRDQVIALTDPGKAIGTAHVEPGAITRAVVIDHLGQTQAICVDQVLGDEEIVVKPLGEEFAGVRGISGATVLGDGGVALIIDVAGFAATNLEEAAPC